MSLFKKLPSPLAVLMAVVVIAALATWLMPAGKYDTLAYQENGTFLLNKTGKEIQLPFTQKTLDSLNIRIKLEKFSNGDIKKPLSVPGTYHRLPKNAQGIVKIIEAPLQGMYDTIDIVLFIMLIGGFISIF
jgi:uncharacterized ion transporter superfamily protein YfcC